MNDQKTRFVKFKETLWRVQFWQGNDIKTIIVPATSYDEAIYNACEKTYLRSIASITPIT